MGCIERISVLTRFLDRREHWNSTTDGRPNSTGILFSTNFFGKLNLTEFMERMNSGKLNLTEFMERMNSERLNFTEFMERINSGKLNFTEFMERMNYYRN